MKEVTFTNEEFDLVFNLLQDHLEDIMQDEFFHIHNHDQAEKATQLETIFKLIPKVNQMRKEATLSEPISILRMNLSIAEHVPTPCGMVFTCLEDHRTLMEKIS